MKRVIIPLTATLFLISTISFAQDVDLLWKARALQATEHLEKLYEEMKEKNSMKIRFEIMLESAYAMILVMPDVTVKKTPKMIGYHIVINYGKEDGYLDIVYCYAVKTYKYLGVRIDKIPKNRGVLLMNDPKTSDYFSVSNNIDTNEETVASLQSFLLSCFSFFTVSAPM